MDYYMSENYQPTGDFKNECVSTPALTILHTHFRKRLLPRYEKLLQQQQQHQQQQQQTLNHEGNDGCEADYYSEHCCDNDCHNHNSHGHRHSVDTIDPDKDDSGSSMDHPNDSKQAQPSKMNGVHTNEDCLNGFESMDSISSDDFDDVGHFHDESSNLPAQYRSAQ